MFDQKSSPLGLIIRQREPNNLETPMDRIDSFLTPTELFFIRSHFTTPTVGADSYRLQVDGAVKSPFALTYEQLRGMPSESRVVTLECAGNSRVFLVPQVDGAQWELGAVGNAEWTGVPLAVLLERPAWKTMPARSSSKEPIEGRPRNRRFPPARLLMPAAFLETRQRGKMC